MTAWVSAFVTTMSFAPAVPEGVVQVRDEADTKVTDVQETPPTVTVGALGELEKFPPVMVIEVLPLNGPAVGETLEMVGAGLA